MPKTENNPFLILIHALPILRHRLHILIHALPILIPLLGFRLSAPYPNTCIAYSYVGFRLHIFPDSSRQHLRLSAPYLNTLPTRQPIRIEHPRLDKNEHYANRVVSQSASSIKSPESSTNQNRALRHPSRHYVTPESSRLGVRTLLGSRLESAAIFYLSTWRNLTPCSSQLTLLLLVGPCVKNDMHEVKEVVKKNEEHLYLATSTLKLPLSPV